MSVSPYRPNRRGADGNPSAPKFRLASDHLSLPSVASEGQPDRLWLTDDILFNYQRCRRRAFLDVHGDQRLRDAPSNYLKKLHQDSYSHQLTVLSDDPAHQPDYPWQDWQHGTAATLQLMRQGVERITKGILCAPIANGVNLISAPSLLVKQPGRSRFGDWHYVPMEVRLGKRPKVDYQVSATFHAYVLAAVQGRWPDTSWLMLRQRGSYAVDLVDMFPRMEELLQDCIAMLLEEQEPEVFIAHNRCDLCHWFSYCYRLAKQTVHLSLLPGVTPSRYVYLKELQITTLDALATANPKRLEPLPGFGAQVTQRMIRQAQATLQNQAMVDVAFDDRPAYPLFSERELPTAAVELYFDIEAAPDQNLAYLHGVLVVDRQSQTEQFYALLAETHDQEWQVWEQFLELVWRYPQAPIFHFCPYEVQTVKRLADQYNTPAHRVAPLMQRFVDLHERVTRVAILPVESYALKPIARWVGFDWRDPDANGAQSICWYAQWVSTGDRTPLEAILRYNEDDCRATYWVKNWLVEFSQRQG